MDIIQRLFSLIWSGLKFIWASLRKIQSVVGTLLFIILMVFIVMSILQDRRVSVPKQGAMVVSLEGIIQEQETYSGSPLQALSATELKHQTILRNVIKSIDLAAKDDRITTLIIDTGNLLGAMPSKLHYIGQAMKRFRETGKKVLSYGDNFSQSGYLVASYSDEIYLNPQGAILLYGYGSYQNYFKDFLEKIKVEVQLFRVGKYKSAMEPFIRRDMSPEAKEASRALLDDLWAEYSLSVTSGRGITKDNFLAMFENVDQDLKTLNGNIAALALQYKLVDGLKTREEWRMYLGQTLGAQDQSLKDKVIDYRSYLASFGPELTHQKDMIAVVYANGAIMDGQHPAGIAGGDTVSRHLREARLNNKVKAVVLRVDSPGGSAFASEIIRQEVLQLKKAGKPVVVSMGSLAASGGYWISASADEIWASPTTITGSIGIFGAIPNFEGTLTAIGINTDGVGTTPLSVSGIGKPLPEKVKSVIQSNIENGYDRFLHIVSEGRSMTVERVNEIAQGRVWTGNAALEIGLVDKLGTFDDAVLSAAKMAGLKDYAVTFVEDPIPWEVKLIADLMNHSAGLAAMLKAHTMSPQNILAARIMEKLSLFGVMNDPNNAYVLCLSCLSDFDDRR